MRKTLIEKKVYVRHTLLLFILTFCSIVTAQAQSKEITVMVSPDKADCLYSEKQPCTFTIRVFKAQNELKEVAVDYELGPLEYPTEKKTNQSLKNGKLEVKGNMPVPGFLRCKVTAHIGGRTYTGLATVGYAPEKIKPVTDCPDDFKTYWESTLEKARRTELSPTSMTNRARNGANGSGNSWASIKRIIPMFFPNHRDVFKNHRDDLEKTSGSM